MNNFRKSLLVLEKKKAWRGKELKAYHYWAYYLIITIKQHNADFVLLSLSQIVIGGGVRSVDLNNLDTTEKR